jgi:hypothetical protein
VDRGELKLRVSRVLGIGLGASDDAADEDAMLNELANEAVLDILQRTRIHVRRAEVVFASGATEFDLDPQILRLYEIERVEGRPLLEQPRDRLGPDGFAFAGYHRIVLGAAGTGETALLWYTPRPTPMSLDTHDPSEQAYGRIPEEHHRAIINYMCWWMADKAGDTGSQRGEKYRLLYEGQDAQGGPGSNIGGIRLATSTRGGLTRIKRQPAVLNSDLSPSYWQG